MSAWLEASFNYKIGQFNLQVDFTMEREIGVLFGPSGAGKSLTLRLLAGLESPVRGSMLLGNRKLVAIPGGRTLRPRERRIGLVFQHLALFPHLTALENVAYGLTGKNRFRQAGDWLERMHLQELVKRYPAQLSGGQKQRVALARALATEPDLLLLDEPFSTLEGPLRRSLRRELKRLHRETQTPLLYVTHHIEDVCSLGHRIFFIKDGRLTGSIPVGDLWSSSSQAGAWPALGWGNLLHGRVKQMEGGIWFLWQQGALELSPSVRAEGGASIFIPPHQIKLLYPDIPVDPQLAQNIMEGRVVERLSLGSNTSLFVAAAGLQWQVEFPQRSYTDIDLNEGAKVRLAVRPESITILDAKS